MTRARKPVSKAVRVKAMRLPHGRDLPLPAYQSAGAAGMDLLAAVDKPVTLQPGARALVPTGLVLEIPPGFEGQVRPRSGLALRHGITALNSPGTIDSDYRGEVQVLLANLVMSHRHRPRRAHRQLSCSGWNALSCGDEKHSATARGAAGSAPRVLKARDQQRRASVRCANRADALHSNITGVILLLIVTG